MDYSITHFEKFNDERGQLVVFLKNSNLDSKFKEFGQIYFVTFEKEHVVRGNHYHKKWREWFGVVSGNVKVKLKDVVTGEEKELFLDGESEKYVRLEIGPNVAHAFMSISPKAALLNYTDMEWSADDTIAFKLI